MQGSDVHTCNEVTIPGVVEGVVVVVVVVVVVGGGGVVGGSG